MQRAAFLRTEFLIPSAALMSLNEPLHAPDSFPSLHEVLRTRRTVALIADAELIRDAPAGQEREDEARRAIREVMLLFALRRISGAERDRILDILSFATITEPPPDLESPADLPDIEPHGPVA